jgi:AcrR family transcriptional regulator
MIEVVQLSTLTSLPVAATEDRLVSAAERCMRVVGLRFSMNDVAAQAGLSRGSVYRYFPDRDTLVRAVLARLAERFVASSEPVVRRRRTLATQVAEAALYIRGHLGDETFTLQRPGEDDLLATLLTARAHDLMARWVEFWQPFIADARTRGEIRDDLDPQIAAEWIVRMLFTFALLPSPTIDLDDDDELRRFVTAHLVRGLAPRTAT